MKQIVKKMVGSITAVVCLNVLVMTSIGAPSDDTWSIARDFDLPGKYKHRQCDPFAKQLYTNMVNAGGEAHYIVYSYVDNMRNKRLHAFVVYRDSKGDFYGMDNMTKKPIWLSGKKPAEWAKRFANPVRLSATSFEQRRHYNRTEVVKHVYERSNIGQYASYERKLIGSASSLTALR